VYRAFLTRASSGDIDNTPVIDRILGAREEQAKLLGFSCFADKSMASKVSFGCQLHLTAELRGLPMDPTTSTFRPMLTKHGFSHGQNS